MNVVDTTVVVDHARGQPAIGCYLADHHPTTLIVSTVSFQELAVGEVAARDQTLAAIRGHLGAFDSRPHTAEHAYEGAVIEATLRERGDSDPALARAVLIGGVARAFEVPVVTQTPDQFETFDAVEVETC